MATNNIRWWPALLLLAGSIQAREASTDAECALVSQKAPIADARTAAAGAPADLKAQFKLADAWSEAGCFNDALQVLSQAERLQPGNHELETRLRVARSVVGEEHFFDNLDRADDQARIKRNAFRCTSLQDVEACTEVVNATPNDAQALSNQGDALLKAHRAGEALGAFRRAAALAPGQPQLDAKVASALAQTDGAAPREQESHTTASISPPPRTAVRVARLDASPPRYSNLEPETRSH